MEYSPPPLFKQGASARAKVVFFSLIALILLVADSRMRSLTAIRQFVGTVLYPLQVVALLPRDAAYVVGDYFTSLSALEKENKKLKQQQVANAQTLQQVQQLSAENEQLRRLLAANERVPVKSVMSEILYDARDAFTRKIVLDRGSQHGIKPGQPVIDDVGVVGQVTRVFPFTSEVTLLTDKDQAIPVQVVRSGLRSVAYGQGHSGVLDLRFMPTNVDIKSGDVLVTSGIDGVYPAGLAVAKVSNVESKSSDAFARITCQPAAGIDRNRQLLILLTDTQLPPRPEPEDGRDKKAKKHPGDVAKDAKKEGSNKEGANAAPAAPATQPAPAPQPNAPAPQLKTPQQPGAQPAAASPATPAAAAPAAPVAPVQAGATKPAATAPQSALPQRVAAPQKALQQAPVQALAPAAAAKPAAPAPTTAKPAAPQKATTP
ncbi:rod shape-determining protein MreC [Noviherbaspirillum sp. UKPF54]|uniref:rod shape-determining protein MreC n=1 Tax=Noviherbaspirillum sp. UKPF54 TaxID=2601898 RepID=UPI0011B1B0AD|nr:rod shape-determining protein MreC [Noviherbaspirillum sp. UKPF54]QDZ29204.1 rod shape-determining protein MreC [Noviherbaspirillum sp. UKPF54]